MLLKKVCQIISIGSFFIAATLAHAEDVVKGCALKEQEIQKQIDYAKAYGNTNKQAGLETALKNLQGHCTDSNLRSNLEANIAKKQQKVDERQAELNEVTTKGDTKKIAKKQKKLALAQKELENAKKELGHYFN